MRIFTRKSFRFRVGGQTVTTKTLDFIEVPDWVKKDPIFDLALKEGSIEIINSRADEKLIETAGTIEPIELLEQRDKKKQSR